MGKLEEFFIWLKHLSLVAHSPCTKHFIVYITVAVVKNRFKFSLYVPWYSCLGQAAETHMNKILLLQKRILCFIYSKEYRAHTIPQFTSANILPVSILYCRLPITRTLANSNLPLTQTNCPFLSGHFLYNFTLDNSNLFQFPLKV